MPTIDDMFPKRHLVADDLQGRVWTLEIAGVRQEKLFIPTKNAFEEKWIVQFKGAQKYFILNKTTANQIAEILGTRDADAWTGKKISVYADSNVKFKGQLVTAIRCRKPANGLDAAPPPTITGEDEDDEL